MKPRNEIIRRADPGSGPIDGVEAEIGCVVTSFKDGIGGKRAIRGQKAHQCRALCSCSEGVLSLSVRKLGAMITIRLDEAAEMIKAAVAASAEAGRDKETGSGCGGLLEELESIPFEDSDEAPSGRVLAEDWRMFKKGSDRQDIVEYVKARRGGGLEAAWKAKAPPLRPPSRS
jgi:hypothetical protein